MEIRLSIIVSESENVSVQTKATDLSEAQIRPALLRAQRALQAEIDALYNCPYHVAAQSSEEQRQQSEAEPSASALAQDEHLKALSDWISFSASVIKSGEAWSPTCERMRTAAIDGLSRLRAPPAPTSGLEAWIRREFSGWGVAIRAESDPPIPGEPFMSMEVARDLTRRAVAQFTTPTSGWPIRDQIARAIAPNAYWGDPGTNAEQEDALARADRLIALFSPPEEPS